MLIELEWLEPVRSCSEGSNGAVSIMIVSFLGVRLHLTHHTPSGSVCDLGIDLAANVHDEPHEV